MDLEPKGVFDALEVGLRLLREVEADVYGVCGGILIPASTHIVASVFSGAVFPLRRLSVFFLSWD